LVKGGLGRGLDSLIPAGHGEIVEVPVGSIVANPRQPRKAMDPAALQELASSIARYGILQPLLVTHHNPKAGPSPIRYQLIAGERRLEAAKLAGLNRVPVVVLEATAQEVLEMALIENLQRQQLNPLDEAAAYYHLINDFGLTQQEVASRVGISRAAVANRLRLLNLPERARVALEEGRITEGHARAILALESEASQLAVLARVEREGLSVRQTEALVRRWQKGRTVEPPRPRPDADLAAMEARLAEILDARVTLRLSRHGGSVTLRFTSQERLLDALERLLQIAKGGH
jgi:ParB family chromosome partitioning protein